jgi:glycine/betaine/sarcosine/D-proline reductase family selenoprotein B
MRAVHYLNQFFAGMGGEEQAETPPTRLDGAVGPGRGLQAALEGVEIVETLACGDDYFAEHEDDALATLVGYLEELRPDVLVAGPAFGSGRYGYACARVAAAAVERGIPAVAAMHDENPGVEAAGGAYVVPTAVNVARRRAPSAHSSSCWASSRATSRPKSAVISTGSSPRRRSWISRQRWSRWSPRRAAFHRGTPTA